MIKVSHVIRTRYCHQVMALTLAILHQETYKLYETGSGKSDSLHLSFDHWCSKMNAESPEF